MFKYLLEQNLFIYFFVAFAVIGIIIRLIIGQAYKHLLRASLNMGDTENKLIKHIKKKYETCFNLDMTVYNVDSFVDKSVFQYRFCGILLSTWEIISGQTLLIQLVIMPIISIWGVLLRCGQDMILSTLAVGLLIAAFLLIVDNMMNLSYKKSIIRINILDYLDNYYYSKLQNKETVKDVIEEKAKELIDESEKVNKNYLQRKLSKENIDINMLIKSLSEIAAEKERGHQEKNRDTKFDNFDEKIIEDVLKEFFT